LKKLPTADDIQLNLTGFSGNKVEALRINNHTIIRKTSKDKSKNFVLQSELSKLKELTQISQNSELFKIPKILSHDFDLHGNFFYDLEFIPGENLDSSLQKFNSKKISSIAEILVQIIEKISLNNIENKKVVVLENKFLLEKFEETKSLSNNNFSLDLTKELLNEYARKIQELDIINSNTSSTETFCHGDVALDNIIITRNDEIYLIDPLKNKFENILWDFSKVLQSSFTHWNLIKNNNFEILNEHKKIKIKPNENILIFHQHFIKNLHNYEAKQILLYLTSTMTRIVKHAKNEKQICALMLITNELLTNYNDGRYDLNGSLNSLRW
tara:strand:- start:664 stop:1644 length:981 start_codon:yes stop_codon:yes gene_type:complete